MNSIKMLFQNLFLNSTVFLLIIMQGMTNPIVFYNLLVKLDFLQMLDVKIKDKTITFISTSHVIPDNIVLVEFGKDSLASGQLEENFKERIFYASLVKNLLEAEGSVLVLNFQSHWQQSPDNDWSEKEFNFVNEELKKIISIYYDRVVLVSKTEPDFDEFLNHSTTNLPKINNYNYLLNAKINTKIDKDGKTIYLTKYDINILDLQGFFEYALMSKKIKNSSSLGRVVKLKNNFIYNNSAEQIHGSFKSFAVLAEEKYNKRLKKKGANIIKKNPDKIYINYSYKLEKLPHFKVEKICNIHLKCQPKIDFKDTFANKIVIVGFSEGSDENTLKLELSSGKIILGIEAQANIIANLLTNSYYRIMPFAWNIFFLLMGSIILNLLILKDTKKSPKRNGVFIFIYSYTTVTIAYLFFVTISLANDFVLPIVFPVLTWFIIGSSSLIFIKYLEKSNEIKKKELEMIVTRSAERKSLIVKIRTLLKRSIVDIHDGPLQNLKVVMDEIELGANPDLVLNRLEQSGVDIRNYLKEIKQISDRIEIELEISPILNEGLDIGIKLTLRDLIHSEKLILNFIDEIESIKEPIDCAWIEMREDIYRFFKEAINNVISHAQQPNGTATQVRVILKQEKNKYFLIIENDGTTKNNNSRRGGLGNQLMAAIAEGLPNGNYNVSHSEDSFKVELTWEFGS